MLQIGAVLFYYKLGQTLLQIGAASLLQSRASVVTNWRSYYILGQLLLQNTAATTYWGTTALSLFFSFFVNIIVVLMVNFFGLFLTKSFCSLFSDFVRGGFLNLLDFS